MTNLWYGVAFLFTVGQIFSLMLDGGFAIATSQLNGAITSTSLFIPIDSSNGFLADDTRVFIEDEELTYTSILSSVDGSCASPPCLVIGVQANRGINGTDAAAHSDDTKVATEAAGLINQVVGFRIGEVDTVVGAIRVPFQLIGALSKFAAKAVIWDYSFLEGNAEFIRWILLYPLSIAFVVSLLSLLREGFSGLFGR